MKKKDEPTRSAFYIPWPPSANHIWRSGGGRVYKSAKYESFIQQVSAKKFAGEIPPIAQGKEYAVHLTLYPPTRARYDVDNRIKATFDALTRVRFWDDDSQVKFVTALKHQTTKGGAIFVVVETYEEREKRLAQGAAFQKRKASNERTRKPSAGKAGRTNHGVGVQSDNRASELARIEDFSSEATE